MSSKQGCGSGTCAISPNEFQVLGHACTCTEAEIQNAILLKYGAMPGVVLWRNNRGTAQSVVFTKPRIARIITVLTKGLSVGAYPAINAALDLIRSFAEESPRFTPYGLTDGASDIIGMVTSASRLAVFVAIEVKRPNGVVTTKAQHDFIALVNRSGGSAGLARSVPDAGVIINKALRAV